MHFQLVSMSLFIICIVHINAAPGLRRRRNADIDDQEIMDMRRMFAPRCLQSLQRRNVETGSDEAIDRLLGQICSLLFASESVKESDLNAEDGEQKGEQKRNWAEERLWQSLAGHSAKHGVGHGLVDPLTVGKKH